MEKSVIEPAESKLTAHQAGFECKGPLEVRSPNFKAGEWLPRKYTQEGDNVSPGVIWSALPPGIVELALICEDANTPLPEPYVHWLIYNISPMRRHIPED